MLEEILVVKIQNALKEGNTYYDSTRGHWKVDHKRIPNLKFVVGVANKEVVCCYEVNEWSIVEDGPEKGRVFFVGSEASFEFYHLLRKKEDVIISKFGVGSEKSYISLQELEET